MDNRDVYQPQDQSGSVRINRDNMIYRTTAHSGNLATKAGELEFPYGSILDVISEEGDGWAVAINPLDQSYGMVPLSHLERICCYDALEESWKGVPDDLRGQGCEEQSPPIPPRQLLLPTGQLLRVEPVLGLVMCDFVGEKDNQLSVFRYDIIQVIKQQDPRWIYVCLKIPALDRVMEGLVPRACVEIQQVSLASCRSSSIQVESLE